MLWPAIAAFLTTGGWYLLSGWPIQLLIASRQKESTAEGIVLGIIHNIRNIMQRPLIVGALTGLLIGDFKTGLEVGAVVQLMFLGVFVVGASIPPNPLVATALAVVFVSRAGASVGEAVAFVLPVAVLSQMLMMACLTWNSFFYQIGAKAAADGDIKKVEFTNAILQPLMVLINCIPAFLGVYFGTGLVQKVVQAFPAWLTAGFGKLGGILPLLGFALLLYTMVPGSLTVLFIAGFIVGTLANVPPLAMAAIAICLAIFVETLRGREAGEEMVLESAGAQVGGSGGRRLSLSERVSLWWRNTCWFNVASWDVLGGWGFAYQMVPVIRRLYRDGKDRAEALSRHMTFWNTNIHAGAVIPGMVVALEEEHAEDPQRVTAETVQSVKVATMGPLAGIGDSIFHATLAPIILALGSAMVQAGNSFGLWLSVVLLLLMYAGAIWYLLDYGYRLGVNVLTQLRAGGLIDRIAEGAKITGLVVAGTMGAKLSNVAFKVSYTAGGQVIELQKILNGFMPKLPELALVFVIYWLLKKGVSALWITLALMAFAVLGAFFGFLA